MMQIERMNINDVNIASDNVPPDSRYQKLINFGLSEINRFEKEKVKRQCTSALNIKIESEYPSGSISLEALSLVSGGLQRVFNSICNNLIGNKKSSGPIPKEVLDYSNLILVNSSAGSFNMHIDQFQQTEQLTLLGIADLELLPELENAFQIIQSTENDVGKIVEQYGPRTFNIMNKWFYELQQNNIEFTIMRPDKDSIVFTKDTVKSTYERLADVKVKESSEIEVAKGFIVGANPITNTLSITLESGEKISAQASPKILHQNLVLLTTTYTIRFNVTNIKHVSTGKTNKSYQVIDIA
ncbi:hypothetical protein [Lysinibacillus piscis]|nr:hypothetical protein [Lysinibacillus sp. KH24]